MSKTIFITGASAGLGKATAKLFASKGWKVIATMRKPENEIELNQIENVTVLPLDVTNLTQIKETTQKAIASEVDVVFNNAGYGLYGAMEAVSDEQVVQEINTNVLGVLRVTQAFIPYFREKKAGMFITTTSIGGHVSFPLGSVYHATKWALEGWSESVSFELKQFGIIVKTVAPGLIKTDFNSRSLDYVPHPEYTALFEKLFSAFKPDDYSAPEPIAEIIFEAATDGKDTLRYLAGADAIAIYKKRQQIGDEAFRKELEQAFLN